MKFSQTSGCFYPDDITYPTGGIPTDAIVVTQAEYNAAMSKNSNDTLSVVAGVLTIIPYAGPTLVEAQATQIATVTLSYENAITAPLSFTTAAGTKSTFPQTDQAKNYLSQALISNAVTKTWNLNFWQDMNNVSVTPFTYADLQNLSAAMENVETPDYMQLLSLIGKINSATTVAAVQAIVWV